MGRRDAPIPYPLFGLQSLKGPIVLDLLIITEGKKCASVLHQLNWPAVSPALGAQNPSRTDWNPCRYYNRFIILYDNDKAGISFAQKVTAIIRRIHPSSVLYVGNLTPDIKGGDLVDWLQNTILRGNWNGIETIPRDRVEIIKTVLVKETKELMVTCEECPHVCFKPTFEEEPRPFLIQLTPVPSFPLEIFPEKVENYISIIATRYSQVPD